MSAKKSQGRRHPRCRPEKAGDVRLVLSPLELRVALLARAGLSRWEIATALSLQEGTVKSQLERVTAKLKPGWKENPELRWPGLQEEVLKAVQTLRGGPPTAGRQAAKEAAAAGAPGKAGISYTAVRRAVEGGLVKPEAGILQLLGHPSGAGRKYLQQARSFQWQLVARGNGDKVMYIDGGARFWLKPALEVLLENKYLRFWQSDSQGDSYRPMWLRFVAAGRARGTKPAYYKITAGSGDRVCSYLGFWVLHELENYVASLYEKMQQRWQALQRLACMAGKPAPPPLPTPEELLKEARAALGMAAHFYFR